MSFGRSGRVEWSRVAWAHARTTYLMITTADAMRGDATQIYLSIYLYFLAGDIREGRRWWAGKGRKVSKQV